MKSGIYKIINITNNHFYIGSAKNLYSRQKDHFNRLYNGTHPNIILQRSYDKYKFDSFKFEILEECSKEILIEREQYYLDNLKPKYNICQKAYSRLGVKHTEETKIKMRLSKLGKKQSESHRKNTGLASIGRKYGLETALQKIKSNPLIILNENLVREIKVDLNLGIDCRTLSNKYNIKYPTIRNIKYNTTWKHVQI